MKYTTLELLYEERKWLLDRLSFIGRIIKQLEQERGVTHTPVVPARSDAASAAPTTTYNPE